MNKIKKDFGFYPEPIQIDAGPVSVRPLSALAAIVDGVSARDSIQNDWIHAPYQQVHEFVSGEIRMLPYSSRVFGLPHTHTIEHETAVDEEHIEFHVWALSFFLGMRLTTSEEGFLDASPVKPGKLVDFVIVGRSIEHAVVLAERFLAANRGEPRNALRFEAAVHALFLGQNPQSLQFERFIYLYTAMDACYKLGESLGFWTNRHSSGQHISHARRISHMCDKFGMPIPKWARLSARRESELSAIRNNALHEALFMDAPFGFSVHGVSHPGNLTREMRALVCRFLVALIGGMNASYVKSDVNSRQRQGLDLS